MSDLPILPVFGSVHSEDIRWLQKVRLGWPTHFDEKFLWWEGDAWPVPSDAAAPDYGQPVVYMLGSPEEIFYLGSTDRFRSRMAEHARRFPCVTWWEAWPCATRKIAYAVEKDMLAQHLHQLPFNRRPW